MEASVDPVVWLRAKGAQGDVIDGIRRIVASTPPGESGWAHLWTSCPRGDWLLGIASRLGVPHVSLAKAAVACARTALDLTEGPEAARVLLITERWIRQEADATDVRDATRRLEEASARVASPEADAAARAALAVGLGVEDSDVLVTAASAAAEAVIVATIDCGMPLVMSYAHAKCADAVRANISWSEVEAAIAGVLG